MKSNVLRLFAVSAAVVLLVLGQSLYASAKEIERNYPAKGITKIDAEFIFQINVTKGKTDGVKILYNENAAVYADYVIVKVEEGKLKLRLSENMDRKLKERRSQTNNCEINVFLNMENIEEIELSGVSSLKTREDDIFTPNTLEVDLSGVSTATINARCSELDVELSGVSRFTFSGEADRVKCDISGNSSATINASAKTYAELEISGASSLHMNGLKTRMVDIESSGACKSILKGVTEKLKVEASGACNVNAKNLVAKYANAEASGAAKCSVNATQSLEWFTSGVAAVTYYGNPKIINTKQAKGLIKGN